jgi:hypothetical protein
MRNADQAPEGRAGPPRKDTVRHREEDSDMWNNPTLQGELANLIITERVRRASRQRRIRQATRRG